MAHNLNETNGKYSFASSLKEPAWHKLGQNVGRAMTSEEALCEANLCWTVEKHKIYREIFDDNGNGSMETIESHMETRRIDTGDTMGIVGKDYEVVDNAKCFTFFDNIVGQKQAIFETAGALHKGQVVFITAKLPKEIVIGPVDLIKNYIALCTSHDGSLALTSFFTPVRVVCNNTMDMALRSSVNRIYLRHTKNIEEQMLLGAKLMGLHSNYMDKVEQAYNLMYDTAVDDKTVQRVLNGTFLNHDQLHKVATEGDVELSTRKANTIKAVWEYYETSPTIDNCRGTAYGVFNAVTGYFQNVRNYFSPELKLKNTVLHGTAHNFAQKAFDQLIKL